MIRTLWIQALCLALSGAGASAQEPTPVPSPSEPERQEPAPAETQLNALEAELTVGPTPGVRTVSLKDAVALALQGNFAIRNSLDGLQSAQIGVSTAKAQFYPRLTPFLRGDADDRTFGSQPPDDRRGEFGVSGVPAGSPDHQHPGDAQDGIGAGCAALRQGYASCWGRSSVISYQGAFEPTKM